jgi:hypothetical protein
VIVQHFDSVAVKDGDDGARKVSGTGNGDPGGKEGTTKEIPYGALGIHVQKASTGRVTSFSWDPDKSSSAHRATLQT